MDVRKWLLRAICVNISNSVLFTLMSKEHEYPHLTNCSLNNMTHDMAFKDKQDLTDEKGELWKFPTQVNPIALKPRGKISGEISRTTEIQKAMLYLKWQNICSKDSFEKS